MHDRCLTLWVYLVYSEQTNIYIHYWQMAQYSKRGVYRTRRDIHQLQVMLTPLRQLLEGMHEVKIVKLKETDACTSV